MVGNMKNIGQGTETLSQRVARRLRARMGELQLRGTEVAAAIGMTQGSFSRRYTGAAAWELDELELLEAKVGISIAYLLGWDDSPTQPQLPVTGAIPYSPPPPQLPATSALAPAPAEEPPADPPATPAPPHLFYTDPRPIRYDHAAWPTAAAVPARA